MAAEKCRGDSDVPAVAETPFGSIIHPQENGELHDCNLGSGQLLHLQAG